MKSFVVYNRQSEVIAMEVPDNWLAEDVRRRLPGGANWFGVEAVDDKEAIAKAIISAPWLVHSDSE